MILPCSLKISSLVVDKAPAHYSPLLGRIYIEYFSFQGKDYFTAYNCLCVVVVVVFFTSDEWSFIDLFRIS